MHDCGKLQLVLLFYYVEHVLAKMKTLSVQKTMADKKNTSNENTTVHEKTTANKKTTVSEDSDEEDSDSDESSICYKFCQVMKIRAPVMRMRTVDMLDLASIKVRRVIAVKMKVMRMTVLKVRAVKVETVIYICQ